MFGTRSRAVAILEHNLFFFECALQKNTSETGPFTNGLPTVSVVLRETLSSVEIKEPYDDHWTQRRICVVFAATRTASHGYLLEGTLCL